VSDLTPEQEAWYALGWNLPRSELSAAAQLEYDRFKPDWEHDAKLRQEAIWAKVHKVDQTGTIHKFCFHPHRQVIIGVMIAAFGAAILAAAVALGLFDFSQTGLWWEICFVAMGLFCVWAAICRFRMGVRVSGQKLIIRNEVWTHIIDASDVRAITLKPKNISEVRTHWEPWVELTSGRGVWIYNFDCGPARWRPRPELVAIVKEVRAMLGVRADDISQPETRQDA